MRGKEKSREQIRRASGEDRSSMDGAGDKVKRREGQASGTEKAYGEEAGFSLPVFPSTVLSFPMKLEGRPGSGFGFRSVLNGGFSIILAAALSCYPLSGIAGSPGEARFAGTGSPGEHGSGAEILAAVSEIPDRLHEAAGRFPRKLDRITAGLRNGSAPLFNVSQVPEPDEETSSALADIPAGGLGLPPGDLGGNSSAEVSHARNPSSGGRISGKSRIRRISGWDNSANAF